MAMTTLAERVEAADGPDRELDAEIAKAVGHPPILLEKQPWTIPGYTGSIDAAMSLIRPGHKRVEFGVYENGHAWAYVHDSCDTVGEADDHYSIPLALTAAALRARESKP